MALAEILILNEKHTKAIGDEQVGLKPMGTGPYKLAEWVKEDRLVMDAFADHWRDKAKIDKVAFKPIPNRATRPASPSLSSRRCTSPWAAACRSTAPSATRASWGSAAPPPRPWPPRLPPPRFAPPRATRGALPGHSTAAASHAIDIVSVGAHESAAGFVDLDPAIGTFSLPTRGLVRGTHQSPTTGAMELDRHGARQLARAFQPALGGGDGTSERLADLFLQAAPTLDDSLTEVFRHARRVGLEQAAEILLRVALRPCAYCRYGPVCPSRLVTSSQSNV